MKLFPQWLREAVMTFSVRFCDLSSTLSLDPDTHDWLPEDANGATVLDRLRWKVENVAYWVFGIAYDGSDAEIRSVYHGEIPTDAMSERQRAWLLQFDLTKIDVVCYECHWEGVLSETHPYAASSCPHCGEHGVSLEPFDPDETPWSRISEIWGELRAPTPSDSLPPYTGPVLLLTEGRAA